MNVHSQPPGEGTREPDMLKIMATLYELWFLEHGADVKVTCQYVEQSPVKAEP